MSTEKESSVAPQYFGILNDNALVDAELVDKAQGTEKEHRSKKENNTDQAREASAVGVCIISVFS